MTHCQPHSIWLCPDKAAQGPLTERIAKLSETSGVPAFEPHVTLLGDLKGPPETTARACQRIIVPPVTARVTGVGHTEAFFMALFLDVALTPDLRETRAALAQDLGAKDDLFRPHLSLAYGSSADLRSPGRQAALENACLGTTFVLDHICIVASARDIPVEDWQQIHRIAL